MSLNTLWTFWDILIWMIEHAWRHNLCVKRKKVIYIVTLKTKLNKFSTENQNKSTFTFKHCILNTGNALVISKCGPRACFMPSLRQCLWAECWIIDEMWSWIKRQVCLCLCLSVCADFSCCVCCYELPLVFVCGQWYKRVCFQTL